MVKNTLFFIVLLFLLSCRNTIEQPKSVLKNSDYSQLLNKRFTGDIAYQTTAFVEKYWRVVGNTGFNKSIYKIAEELEKAGFILEDSATKKQRFTYRIEKRPLAKPTWEPIDASVTFLSEEEPLLHFYTNRNMIAINSYSTPKNGISAEVIYIKNKKELKSRKVKGKIVFMETNPYDVFTAAIKAGAIGIMTYNNPKYIQPKKNDTSIQFRSIPLLENAKSWAIALSYQAKEKLKAKLQQGKTFLKVNIATKIVPSEELTIIADIRGNKVPEERLVVSAHIQEPGANDNASGVGLALEMATLTAQLIRDRKLDPKRTLTFLWGDEIISTNRYVTEDSNRAKHIKWGISLDMVGEDTQKTGGSFLIEKMPDPSAIWTRGKDQHTEWGSTTMSLKDMQPHYLNDFLIDKFQQQAKLKNWTVHTNPYEGGSDHVPFLRADIPSALFWHFTDQFYHTDNDRLDKVSQNTLKNVGVASLHSIYSLLNADKNLASYTLQLLEKAALTRIKEEEKQSNIALQKGDSLSKQITIITAWKDWYTAAASSTTDMVSDASILDMQIGKTKAKIDSVVNQTIQRIARKK